MLVFKKSYYKKIKDLERELEKSKKNEKNLKEIIELNVENPVNEKNKEISKLIEINSKLEKQLNSGKVTNEKNKELLNNISRNTKDLKEQLTNLLSENKALQPNLKLKVTELEKETNICKGEKLKVENLEREVNESKAREAKLQKMLNLDLENQKDEIKKLKAELIQKNSKLDREISISKGEKLEVENLEREVKESKAREGKLKNMLDLDLETQKKKEVELKQNIVDQILLNKSMKLDFEDQLANQTSEIKKLKANLKLKESTLERETSISKGEKLKVENLEREVKESRAREAKLKNMLDLGLEDQNKKKAELEKKIEALVKDKLTLEKKLENRVAENKRLRIELRLKDEKIKALPTPIPRSEALLKHEIEDLKQKRNNLFELVKASRAENSELKKELELTEKIKLDIKRIQGELQNISTRTENEKLKVIAEFNKQSLENENLKNDLDKFNKENKDLQDKLHQKERAAFKLSIISKEATNNLSLLKEQVELLSNDNIKYKTEINSLKEQLKEAEKSKQLKILPFDPINKSKDSLEKQTQDKENLKPISTSQFNEDSNTPADIKSLNKKQWNEILEFGTKHKIFNNRDKQKLNNIIVRLKIREPLRPAQIEEGQKLFNLVVKNGFSSSVAVPLSTPKKIEEKSCLTPFGKEFNRKNSNISEEKTPEVLDKTIQLDEDELLEKVKTFKYDEWTQMFEWAKKKKKLKSKDLSLLNGLAIRSSNKELSENELILGLELYFILMSEGFELVKEKDVDDFLMQFTSESNNDSNVTSEKDEIPDALKSILF